MKQNLKEYKGITLIALIITIIVLLILAVVAISVVNGNGILNHAQNAKREYSQAQTNEQATLDGYLEKLNTESAKINGGGVDGKTVKGSLNKIINTQDNTPLTDEYGNKITVPAGFKILVDGTTNYTADNINVTKGIVVEDGEENQFVWIPVGTIYTNAEKTESKTITLGRYSNFTKKADVTYTVAQDANAVTNQTKINSYHTEDTTSNHNSSYGNAIAKNIGEFCTKANSSGGYYIARYEARVENYDASNISTANSSSSTDWTGYVAESGKKLKLVSKANSQVWNYVTQNKASSLCQNMYTNKPYESDLVNSYAWDTAIIFIQEFENSTYSTTKGEATDSEPSSKGLSILKETNAIDKQCNIYDMAGNCFEWSTETYSYSSTPCTKRGGSYIYSNFYASSRRSYGMTVAGILDSFRPLLYM